VTEGVIHNRATIILQKTERPMQFEWMTKAHNTLVTWLERRRRSMADYIFQVASTIGHLSTHQYVNLLDERMRPTLC
jgi:hypothetical protein